MQAQSRLIKLREETFVDRIGIERKVKVYTHQNKSQPGKKKQEGVKISWR